MSFYGYGSHAQVPGANTTNGFYTEIHVPRDGRNHYTRSSSTPGNIPRATPPRARPRPASSNLRYNSRGQVDPDGHTINEWQSRFGEWFDENYDASDRLTRERLNMDFVDYITSGRAAELNGYDSPYPPGPTRSFQHDDSNYHHPTYPNFSTYESPKARKSYPPHEDDDGYIILPSRGQGTRRSTWSDSYHRPSHRTSTRSRRSSGSQSSGFIGSVFQAVGDLFLSPSHRGFSSMDKGPGSTKVIYEQPGRSNGQGAFIRSRGR